MNYINNKLYKALAMMFVLILVGTFGYKLIGDAYSWIEALYMTIITMTTVGFSEVHPSTDFEKLFTIFLILMSITIYAYVVTVVSEYISTGQFFSQLNKRKMQRKISKLQGHTIVCGYGRNGEQAVERLKSYDQHCVVIESDKEVIDELENKSIKYIEGDATDDSVLTLANIKKADNLITTMPSDADNLFVVLTARQLNKDLTIISRASYASSYSKLKVAGADNIIMPDRLGGNHMASLIVTPDLIEFVERLTIEGKEHTNLEEISIDDLSKDFTNKTIFDLNIRNRTGCLVIGLKKADNEYIINPEGDTMLDPGSHLIVLGNSEQISKLHEVF